MYDTKHKCTYHLAECGEQEYMYRKDMLSFFTLKEFNDDTINQDVKELYNIMKKSDKMCDCMKKAAKMLLSEDNEIGFNLLFSFDYLHLTTICIQSYIDNEKEVFENTIKKLEKKLDM
jgi:hypothetical protein